MSTAVAAARDRISEEIVRKSVNALLKWKTNLLQEPNSEQEEEELAETGDDFMYLSLTLAKIPPRALTLAPQRVPLAHSLLPPDLSLLNFCLIVDGKKINTDSATKILKKSDLSSLQIKVIRLAKLKSDYKSYESKKKLYDSFDVFLAVKDVISDLPNVLGKVFYKKRRKVPVPVELEPDGGNWKEEIERACGSSLLCLSSGTCSVVRVGIFGVHQRDEIVENVYRAIDGVMEIVPRNWRGVKCLHLKFSDSVALPLFERKAKVVEDGNGMGEAKSAGLVGTKRRRR